MFVNHHFINKNFINYLITAKIIKEPRISDFKFGV